MFALLKRLDIPRKPMYGDSWLKPNQLKQLQISLYNCGCTDICVNQFAHPSLMKEPEFLHAMKASSSAGVSVLAQLPTISDRVVLESLLGIELSAGGGGSTVRTNASGNEEGEVASTLGETVADMADVAALADVADEERENATGREGKENTTPITKDGASKEEVLVQNVTPFKEVVPSPGEAMPSPSTEAPLTPIMEAGDPFVGEEENPFANPAAEVNPFQNLEAENPFNSKNDEGRRVGAYGYSGVGG